MAEKELGGTPRRDARPNETPVFRARKLKVVRLGTVAGHDTADTDDILSLGGLKASERVTPETQDDTPRKE